MPRPIYLVKESKSKSRLRRLINIALVLFLGGGLAGVLTLVGVFWYLSRDLPKLFSIDDYKPNVISYVYDNKGLVVGEFKYENQRRIVIPYEAIPQRVINAFVSAEDAGFWRHEGLDFMGMVRALFRNIKTGKFSQGGSTITQQVTRSILLTKEKKLSRKIKEMILALRIEQRFKKEEILFLYLNEIYFGNGAYGVEAAAENYFGKTVDQLTLSEAALIAGLPQAPSRYSPYWNASAARARQEYVFRQMVDEKYITQTQADLAKAEPWKLKPQEDLNLKYAPYFVEHVRKYVMGKYGAEKVLKEGLKIHTTLDTDLQLAANKAVDEGLRELDRRWGWKGPRKHLAEKEAAAYIDWLSLINTVKPKKGEVVTGVVTEIQKEKAQVNIGGITGTVSVKTASWIDRITIGKKNVFTKVSDLRNILEPFDVVDVRVLETGKTPTLGLEPTPKTQSALLAMEPHTRFVLAMVGGRDFTENQFNRAVQAKRQPGSSFKPIVYAAALDAGMTPASIIMDTALVFKDGWRPGNYDGKFKGEMSLREALTKSVNTITIRIVDRIGADYVYRYARRLGISALHGADLSIALGTYELPPIQLINAYAVFASGGKLSDPVFIKSIKGRGGEILEQTILATNIQTETPMANVPDVSNWDSGQDLEQGASAYETVADPVAKQQFYEDFHIEKDKKTDASKSVIAQAEQPEDLTDKVVFKQVISPQTAYLITSIMHSVASRGTGARSNVLGKIVAGKTGTTNDYVDAWFIGFSPDILAGVWVGNDSGSVPIGRGESGSSAALPIWIRFMQEALKEKENKDFPVPEGITVAKIDPKNGLLANPDTPGAFNEYFRSGTEPTMHTPTKDTVNPNNFIEEDLDFVE